MLGPYELLRELGRGGFGTVYSARDTRNREEVAIKVLHDQAGAEARCRFATEVISTGLLRHPNIVRLLDSGTDGERDWYAMELIHGSTLLERLRTGLPKPATAARWLADLAGAVAHAHSNKIVHRDLKPANVLIGGSSGIYLTDFGLAKSLGPALRASLDLELSLTGGLIGTACYMAPEQARGDSAEQGYATDIYGLGALLYHCLTGRPPFVHETLSGILRLVEAEEPVPPRRLNPNVPVGLESICLKCLEKEPSDRYPSAADLAGDLARFLDGKETEARPQPMRVRLFRWARRQPVTAGLTGALIVAIAGGFGGIVWQYRKALGANGQLTELRDRQTIEIATALHARGRTPTAIARLARTIRQTPANGRAAALLASIVQSTRWPVPCFTLGRETSGTEVIAVSPDERHLATLRSDANKQWEIATWSVSDGRSVARWTCPATNEADLSFSQDSSSVHLRTANGSIGWLVDGTPASSPIPTQAEPSEQWPDLDWLPLTNTFSVSRQLRRVAVGNGSWNMPEVSLLDLDTRRPVTEAWKGEELTTRGGFGPDVASGMLVTARSNTLRWRDGRNGQLLAAFLETGGVVLDATWAPSGRWIAVSSLSDPVSAWMLSPAFHPAPLWKNESSLRSVKFNATGERLAVNTATNGTYGLHPDGTEIHLGSAWISAWFADGERLALAGADGIVEVRRWSDPSWSGPRIHLPSPVDVIAVSPDQQWLAAATQDQKLYVWNASTGAPLGDAVPLLPAGGKTWGIARVFGLQFSPDSQRLVVAAASTGAIVELTGLRITYRLGASTPCTSATFSPDGQWAAFGTMSNDITIVSVAPTPRTQMQLEESDKVLSVSFSANSKRLISCSERGSVRVYSVPEGRLVHDLVTEGSTVQWADFSNDGRTLAALSYDGHLWLWDAEYGLALAAPLRLTDRKLTRGHFSADGRKLAIGSIGGAVWVVPLLEHSGPAPEWLPDLAEGLVGQRFNPDGTWERVPPKEFLAVLEQLRKNPPEGPWGEWCERFLSPIPEPRKGAVP
jgi:WD40 repeat protein/nitrate reductase NapE component